MLKKNKHAQALGKRGGLARAAKLTAAQRLAISRAANAAKQQKRFKPVEDTMTPERIAEEYEMICAEMAKAGRLWKVGDLLPDHISAEVSESIHNDLYAFQKRIREHAYALAMEKAVKDE